MYTIKKGTEAIAIKFPLCAKTIKSKQHFTRYELNFFDTLIDPISLKNGRTTGNYCLDGLALIGYSVFMSEEHDKYALAVLSTHVKVQ